LEVVADRDVWRLNLELLPPQPLRTWADSERRRHQLYVCILWFFNYINFGFFWEEGAQTFRGCVQGCRIIFDN